MRCLIAPTHDDFWQAMTSRNGDFIGDRYVKLLRVPHEEMEEQAAGLIATPAAGHVGPSAAAVAALNFQASSDHSRSASTCHVSGANAVVCATAEVVEPRLSWDRLASFRQNLWRPRSEDRCQRILHFLCVCSGETTRGCLCWRWRAGSFSRMARRVGIVVCACGRRWA